MTEATASVCLFLVMALATVLPANIMQSKVRKISQNYNDTSVVKTSEQLQNII